MFHLSYFTCVQNFMIIAVVVLQKSRGYIIDYTGFISTIGYASSKPRNEYNDVKLKMK